MKIQRAYFILLFLIICTKLLSQSSVKIKTPVYDPSSQLDTVIEAEIKKVEFWLSRDKVKALKLAEATNNLSSLKENKEYKIKGLLIFGKALESNQLYKKAKLQYKEAKLNAEKLENNNLLIDALCGLASAHLMLLEKDSAAIIYISAIKLVDKGNDITKKAKVYIQFAEFNRNVVRYSIAIDYLDKVRAYSKTHQLPVKTEIEMYNRYAAIWNESNSNLDSAIYYSKLCISLGETINDMHIVATAHNELASLNKKLYDSGYKEHLLSAIEIWKKMNYLSHEGGAILNFYYFTANTLKDKSNLRMKIHMAEDFLERAKWVDLPLIKQDLHNLLATEYEVLGDTKNALKNFKIYNKLLLENSGVQHLKALSEVQEKFENEKYQRIIAENSKDIKNIKEENLKEQELRKAEEVESRNYLILSISLIVVTGVVIVLILKSKKQNKALKIQEEKTNKTNYQLELIVKEKELLLKEIHHRVKNNLQIVVGLLELQTKRIDDEPVKKALTESISRVRSMSLVHQKLYLGTDLAKVNFKDYIISLIREIELTYAGASKKIEKDINIPELNIDIDTIIPIGLIITELLTNSFKYGFNNENPYLKIEIKQSEYGRFELIYHDNGPGMPDDFEFEKSRSLGIRLIKQLARQLNGSVRYKFDSGPIFFINFEDSHKRKGIE